MTRALKATLIMLALTLPGCLSFSFAWRFVETRQAPEGSEGGESAADAGTAPGESVERP